MFPVSFFFSAFLSLSEKNSLEQRLANTFVTTRPVVPPAHHHRCCLLMLAVIPSRDSILAVVVWAALLFGSEGNLRRVPVPRRVAWNPAVPGRHRLAWLRILPTACGRMLPRPGRHPFPTPLRGSPRIDRSDRFSTVFGFPTPRPSSVVCERNERKRSEIEARQITIEASTNRMCRPTGQRHQKNSLRVRAAGGESNTIESMPHNAIKLDTRHGTTRHRTTQHNAPPASVPVVVSARPRCPGSSPATDRPGPWPPCRP